MPTDALDRRVELRADCSRCAGLCCVALPFARSADFAIDKPAGMPCRHLRDDDRCGIHDRLGPEGFPGCEVFDCFGAGQQVVQVTFGGRSWRDGDDVAGPMFAAFAILRAVHEMRWLLADAATRELGDDLRRSVAAAAERLAAVSGESTERLAALDVDVLRREVGDLLGQVSAAVRNGVGGGLCAVRTWSVATCAGKRCGAPTYAVRSSSGPTCGAPTSAWRICSARTCGVPTCGGRTWATPCSSPRRS